MNDSLRSEHFFAHPDGIFQSSVAVLKFRAFVTADFPAGRRIERNDAYETLFYQP
jgi:hypothetical protein